MVARQKAAAATTAARRREIEPQSFSIILVPEEGVRGFAVAIGTVVTSQITNVVDDDKGPNVGTGLRGSSTVDGSGEFNLVR